MKPTSSERREARRWWQVIAGAGAGVALWFALPNWPDADHAIQIRLIAPALLWPLLEKVSGLGTRVAGLTSAWWARSVALVAFACVLVIGQRLYVGSWPGVWHDLAALAAPLVVVFLMLTAPARPRTESAMLSPTKLRDLLIAVFAFGLLMGWIAGMPDAQQVLAGHRWLWGRAIEVALFAWVVLGTLVVLDWRSRPAA